MLKKTTNGLHYLWKGFEMLPQQGLRAYVLIPLVINTLLFSIFLGVAGYFFDELVHWITSFLPSWLAWLGFLLWGIFALSLGLAVFYTFMLLANLVAAPFNSFLSAKVQSLVTESSPSLEESWQSLLAEIPRTLKRELQKLAYTLPRLLLLFLLFFIPVIQLIAPFAWFIFNAWMFSVQYVDYPADNDKLPFDQFIKQMKTHKLINLSFGSGIALLAFIPIVNFLLIPAAVIGATLMWVDNYKPNPANR